jgi:hypothetical protein
MAGRGSKARNEATLAGQPAKEGVLLRDAIPAQAASAEHILTPEEQAAIRRVTAIRNVRLPHVRIQKADDGSVSIQLEHGGHPAVGACKLAEALGSGDVRLADHLLCEIAVTTANGAVFDEKKLEYALSIVEGIKPADAIETLLATQMAGVHMAAMKGLRYLRDATSLEVQESAANMTNKMMRTFALQVEALKKHRSSGEQIIKVQHVTVNGGQAVVSNGNVNGGRATPEIERQPHEPLGRNADSAALRSPVEAHGASMQSAGRERLERLPVSRSERRSSEGRSKRRVASRATH